MLHHTILPLPEFHHRDKENDTAIFLLRQAFVQGNLPGNIQYHIAIIINMDNVTSHTSIFHICHWRTRCDILIVI